MAHHATLPEGGYTSIPPDPASPTCGEPGDKPGQGGIFSEAGPGDLDPDQGNAHARECQARAELASAVAAELYLEIEVAANAGADVDASTLAPIIARALKRWEQDAEQRLLADLAPDRDALIARLDASIARIGELEDKVRAAYYAGLLANIVKSDNAARIARREAERATYAALAARKLS